MAEAKLQHQGPAGFQAAGPMPADDPTISQATCRAPLAGNPRAMHHWIMFGAALRAVLRWHEKALRGVFRMMELQHHYPFMHSIMRALTPAYELTQTAPHVRVSGQTAYPERPRLCPHARPSQRFSSNASGRYRECDDCGSRWAATVMTNPINQEEVLVYDIVKLTRAYPGAIIPRPRGSLKPRGKSKPPAKPEAQASSASSSAPPAALQLSQASSASSSALPAALQLSSAPHWDPEAQWDAQWEALELEALEWEALR